jgi:hypothetical protein
MARTELIIVWQNVNFCNIKMLHGFLIAAISSILISGFATNFYRHGKTEGTESFYRIFPCLPFFRGDKCLAKQGKNNRA